MALPNIIIIMTDQQRADVCAREGFALDTTPFLDRLAGEGAWFRRAYTCAPVCMPARISMLTGRFPSAHRVRENFGVQHVTFEHDLIDVLRARGYALAMIGKSHSHLHRERLDHWYPHSHMGSQSPDRTPQEKEFDEWLTVLNHGVAQQPAPFPIECQGPYRVVSEAQSWIRSLSGGPFFLWLSIAEPHNPYQAPEPYFSLFPVEELPPVRNDKTALQGKSFKWQWTRRLGEHVYADYDRLVQRARANYLGMLRLIDDQVERFATFLDEEGLRQNTLLVVLSDHGDFLGEYGLMRKGPEMPELLMRIPLIFSGPGVLRNEGRDTAHVSIVDIMPTLCEALGAAIPPGVQGRSLWPLLTGADYPRQEFASVYGEQGFGGLHYSQEDDPQFDHCLLPGPNDVSFDELNSYSQSGTMRMVRKDNWKLVFDMQGHGELYDLSRDPGEMHNLYDDPGSAGVVREMLAEMLAWVLRVQDPLPFPGRYVIKTDPRNYWAPYR